MNSDQEILEKPRKSAAEPRQNFGDNPIEVRETDHYKAEYIHEFVEKWDDLIDWDARAQSEGQFFIDMLRARGKTTVLDVAAGTGFHSVQLLKAGFDVVSVDGSAEMLTKAFENARDRNLVLKTAHADWRWLNRDIHGKFDAIICLGNSFTHLFKEADRRRALAEFYAALKHDGILILDQRNYDAILDVGFDNKHKYYYCGEKITAEPEHIDNSLTRFRYTFPDGSVYHLNMFPLRKSYVRNLMKEVGFQRVATYGDFQETFDEHEPDYLVHIADKQFMEQRLKPSKKSSGTVTDIARDYYDSEDADNFYAAIWGGEDIHIGLYDGRRSIKEASRETVLYMAQRLRGLKPGARVLDIGSGYGGAARVLAREFGAEVTCLNLSGVENERNRALTEKQGLDHLITVKEGSYEDIPEEDDQFDIVWSQDAILHAGDRANVLDEVSRVLKKGGEFIFTDPMQADDLADTELLKPIYDRIHLSSLASFGFYRRELGHRKFSEVAVDDFTDQLRNHYAEVKAELARRRPQLEGRISSGYIDRMLTGLQHWVNGADAGHLAWGVMHFKKD